MTTDKPVTNTIIIPERPSRVNSNSISGEVNHVKNVKWIGSNFSIVSNTNIPEAIVKDKRAEFIVKKLMRVSLINLSTNLIPKAVNRGNKTIANSKISISNLVMLLTSRRKLMIVF